MAIDCSLKHVQHSSPVGSLITLLCHSLAVKGKALKWKLQMELTRFPQPQPLNDCTSQAEEGDSMLLGEGTLVSTATTALPILVFASAVYDATNSISENIPLTWGFSALEGNSLKLDADILLSASAEHNYIGKVAYSMILQSKQKLYESASTKKKGEELLITEQYIWSRQHLLWALNW